MDAGNEPIVELRGVERTYHVDGKDVHALRGVSIKIPENKLIILKGPSGSGKTTVLNIMGGLDQPTKGEMLFKGRDLGKFSDRQLTLWRRQQVGFVFQTFALIQTLSAFENVELPMRITRKSWKERQARTLECLDIVGLRKRGTHRTFEMSGGEQQRVGIARALVNKPALIMADEPTGEVDFRTGIQIMQLFRTMVDEGGITICLTTHDPAFMEYGDLVFEIQDGEIIR